MEAAHQRLIERFGSMAEENAHLSETVKALSKKLDDVSRQQAADGDDADGPSGAAEDPAPLGAEISDEAITGGLTTPSTTPASKKYRLPVKGFVDQNYAQRYGFVLQTDDEEYELRLNGLVQLDSRMYEQGNQIPIVSDLDMPRTRLYFSGRLTRPIEYQISLQRGSNNFDVLNAYFNFHFDDRVQLRFGRYRVPYTYEWAKVSNWEMSTPERSPFAANFGPNRQIGFMGWGNILQNRLEYAVGIFDGPRNSYQDFNNAKDVVAFADIRPFFETDSKSPLRNLSFGASVDAGRQNNPTVPALLRGSINASGNTLASGAGDAIIAVPFLAFNNNVRERGDRTLWELHGTYFYKGFMLMGAWDFGHNDFARVSTAASQPPPVHLPVSGYYVHAAYLLTGEERDKITLVSPLHPFNLKPGKFGLGAWELSARYGEVSVGEEVFTQGLADPNLWTNQARFVDLGINWFMNRYVKFMFDWQHGMYADPVVFRPGQFQLTSDLFWLRFQLYF
jgi:phosphate-selective porin OprO/OprP